MSKFEDFARKHETELKRFVRRHGKNSNADFSVALKKECPDFAEFLRDNHCGAIDGVNKVLGVLATLQTIERVQKSVKNLKKPTKADMKVLDELREDFDFFRGALDCLNDAVDQFSDVVNDGKVSKDDVVLFADEADSCIKGLAEWLKYIKKTGKRFKV